jgi:hypothetical protein
MTTVICRRQSSIITKNVVSQPYVSFLGSIGCAAGNLRGLERTIPKFLVAQRNFLEFTAFFSDY